MDDLNSKDLSVKGGARNIRGRRGCACSRYFPMDIADYSGVNYMTVSRALKRFETA